MFIATNVLLIGIVGLIAYWWANQGLFSALLHLLCVVIAGAIAFAFWEPLAHTMIGGSWFDDYAWGTSLVAIFVVALLLLRLLLDKTVRSNVNFPQWADLAFGGAAGAMAGILTVGVAIIGLGQIQSTSELLGYHGWQRSRKDGQVRLIDNFWLPAHTIANGFYSTMSIGAFRSGRPMAQYAPALDHQASLLRDTYDGGKGKVAIDDAGVAVKGLFQDPADASRWYVVVDFSLAALDSGEQLTLSSSQVRVIEDLGRKPTRIARTAHPVAWRQYSGYHLFDHISHIVTSEPGKDSAPNVVFEFDVASDFRPKFVQIKGSRFLLPEAKAADESLVSRMQPASEAVVVQAGGPITSVVKITKDIRPVNVGLNNMPNGIDEVERHLTQGDAFFRKGMPRAPRNLRIEGIFEPEGARVVQVDVSRSGPANIFGLADRVPEDGRIRLVDSGGTEYSPVGFIYEDADGVRIKLDPVRRLGSLADLPVLPTSGTQKLRLIFYVTADETLTGLMLGDLAVGSCNIRVPIQ